MRAKGMTLMKMPIFTWTSLCSMVLVVSVFPVLTATILLLSLDRLLGMHFFTSSFGGNPMMYVNLIWMWGHPEVYILVLPAFGIFSEVVATFSKKPLFGYKSAVCSAIGITLLSFVVWLHHFFTMGAGADVNAFFGIMTMLIAIPTGVLVFNWIFTMFKGKITFASPMYWFLGFVSTFTFGGMAGVLMASPPADFQIHNSLFLVAHFHTMIIGGALFGIFAGIAYWFPKVTGFTLNERLGKRAFWFWIVGFFMSFVPLYILGFMGATRRLDHYDAATGWQPLFIMAGIGGVVITIGAVIQVWQVIVSIRERRQNRDRSGDPWDGRTLEWATASPAPFYAFATLPEVESRDAFWFIKKNRPQALAGSPGARETKPEDIELPKNTAMAIYLSSFIFLFGFAAVWQIAWLAVLALVGSIACVIIRSFNEHTEYILPAAEVARLEALRNAQ